MKKKIIIFLLAVCLLFGIPASVLAEAKMVPGSVIPKLPQTANDPELANGHVYPFLGPPCQRYTYSVVYSDDKGRKPEYVKIYFNGKMIDMEPAFDMALASKEDYQKGVRYEYKYIPSKLGSNFYYFEASNGLGKARDSIIDSPDNGPVLFESAFDKNEIGLIEATPGKKLWSFPVGKEWVDGVAFSDDGKYLAAKTSQHIYLFKTESSKPLWEFKCEDCMIGGDVKGGIDISGDGSKIIAAIGEMVLLFDKSSNRPLWKKQTGNAYNVAISQDGKYMAAATAGEESNENSNLLILWNEKSSKPLWQYHSSGNFHDVSLSNDGKYIAGATGCPDRQAYIFSRDSNKPIMISGRLTYDSPVSRSKITGDGNLAAFTTEGGPESAVVILFSKDSKTPLWKFADGEKRAARGLGITPDGKFIGVATMGGDIYLLGKESNVPLKNWKVDASTGVFDIADDGSFIATGGTDRKIHIFSKNTNDKKVITFNEYLGSIDISANGKYIAGGTSGAIYFFESFANENKVFACTKVTEPEDENKMMAKYGMGEKATTIKQNIFSVLWNRITSFFKKLIGINGEQGSSGQKSESTSSGKAVCGNNLCEPDFGETKENCAKDCSGGD